MDYQPAYLESYFASEMAIMPGMFSSINYDWLLECALPPRHQYGGPPNILAIPTRPKVPASQVGHFGLKRSEMEKLWRTEERIKEHLESSVHIEQSCWIPLYELHKHLSNV